MKFLSVSVLVTVFTLTSALPIIRFRSDDALSLAARTALDVDNLNEFAAARRPAAAASLTAKKPTAAQVMQAASNFATDATTVSAALNAIPSTTNTKSISAMAKQAFAAETDEDTQRAVLAAASGSAGAASNAKIMKFTPGVLSGLKAIQQNPSTAAKQVSTIQNARNPNILPSITQLSQSAMDATGVQKTAVKFKPTGQ